MGLVDARPRAFVPAVAVAGHSGVMPATLTTRAHLAISAATKAASSAGVPGTGSAPCALSQLAIAGEAMMSTMSRFRRVMVGAGVRAGANIANQVVDSKAGRPAWAAVGISGADADLRSEVIAYARTLPARAAA